MASASAPSPGKVGGLARRTLFAQVAAVMERLGQLHGAQKRQAVEQCITEWKDQDDDSYPLMRLLVPQLDVERTTYGMKETVLAKSIIQALNLARDSPDAQSLLHWRRPTSSQDAGDFAAVAFGVLRLRCAPVGRLTVEQVNDVLDTLNTSVDRGDKERIMRTLVSQCTAVETKWIIRIILRDLKLGMSENTVLAAFHPDALDLYHVCSDLQRVCRELKDRSVRLAEHAIQIFAPFKPMFAQRVPFNEIVEKLNGEYFIEPKLDGERIQLHKRGDEYRYWSRKGKEYTYLYGASKDEGSVTPYIQACFDPSVREIILDGEMVTFNPDSKQFVPFSTLKSAALGTDGANHPCFVSFDIVYLNGECIIGQPLNVRRSFLEKVVRPKEGRLHIVDSYTGAAHDDLVRALDIAIEQRQEGLVVKSCASSYMPSKRVAEAWVKVKPEYIDNLGDSLDVVIVGGYYSDGRRRGGKVTHFMCALADEHSRNGDDAQTKYLSFCKFGSGVTDESLSAISDRLSAHWNDIQRTRPPAWLCFEEEQPELWIDPAKSIVVAIKASEITATKKYAAGFTLRFPRLERIRDDKDPSECMTLEEMHTLRRFADGRLSAKRMSEAASHASPTKRRKLALRSRTVRTVVALYQGANMSKVERVGDVFAGREFCVMNAGDDVGGKQAVEVLLAQNGAAVVQNPMIGSTYCVIADQVKIKVGNVIKAGHFDVLKSAYVMDCIAQGALLPKARRHLLFATDATKQSMAAALDAFGDSFTERVTAPELLDLLSSADAAFPPVDARRARVRRQELASRYDGLDECFGVFGSVVLFALIEAASRAALTVDLLHFRSLGGDVVDEFDATVTHVIVDDVDAQVANLAALQAAYSELDWTKVNVVRKSWLSSSLAARQPHRADMFFLSVSHS